MNSNGQKSNNWILCPSKSIPGKFYYFNVVTGEAVWGLEDTELNALKNIDNMPKLIEKPQLSYPEPKRLYRQIKNKCTSISINNGSLSNFHEQRMGKFNPSLGQAVFPQYFVHTPALMPSIIWMPVQMPTFMNTTEEKQMFGRHTQTSEIYEILIDACSIPLTKRFSYLQNKNIFDSSNGEIVNSSPIYVHKYKTSIFATNEAVKEVVSEKQESSKNIDIENKKFNEHQDLNDSKHSCADLDETDLRRLLIFKRRKVFDSGVLEITKKKEEPKLARNVLAKNGVMFGLNTSDEIQNITIRHENNKKGFMPITLLRNLSKTECAGNNWYITADCEVLLDEVNFLMEYVGEDDLCKLLVPKPLLKSIEELGIGSSEHPSVLTARKVYRKLVYCTSKVQIVNSEAEMSLNDQIVNCCMKTLNENFHLVLFTNNTKLLERAELFCIHAYTIDYIKHYKPKDTNKEKFTMTYKNISNQTENLFNYGKNTQIHENNDKNESHNESNDISNINRNIRILDLNNKKELMDNKSIDKVDNVLMKNSKLIVHDFFNSSAVFSKSKKSAGNNNADKDNIQQNTNSITNVEKWWNSSTDSECQIKDRQKTFYLKNKQMENNLITRMDEYICMYVQIMEDLINILLRTDTVTQSFLPCSFCEGLECFKEFCFDTEVKGIIEILLALWKKCTVTNKDITPQDFIDVMECGWLLIETLKDFISDDIKEIIYLYTKLIENIETPIAEDVDLIQTPAPHCQEHVARNYFVKDQSEIVQYLKKHFSEWKGYEMLDDTKAKNNGMDKDINILRTSGKHLHCLKIDNKKRITFDNNKDNVTRQKLSDNEFPVSHVNTFETNNNDAPKIIRNMKLTEEFDDKLKKTSLDVCEVVERDFSINKIESNETVNDVSFNETNDVNESNDVDDSGIDSESLQRHKCGEMQEGDRTCFYEKATLTYKQMNNIIDDLKSIIERESTENGTLKSLLIKADEDTSGDKRILRYRQTVMKCLEQAQILNSCLKLVISINEDNTNEETSSSSYNVGFFNIFE